MYDALRAVLPVLLVALLTALGMLLELPRAAASLVLMAAVVGASLLGRLPGVLAALSGAVAVHGWFRPGAGLGDPADRDDFLTLGTYVAVALVIGTLVTRVNGLRRQAQLGEREARIRLDLKRRLLQGDSPDDVVQSAAVALTGLFTLAACRLRVGAHRAGVSGEGRPGRPHRIEAGDLELEAVPSSGRPLSEGDRAVIEALATGLAASVRLVDLGEEAERARKQADSSRLRARVLSAVSHNLRTPLAAIRASAELLEQPELDAAARDELVVTVREESARLERIVANTLDLGRIRAGGLQPELVPVDVGDVARAAARRLAPLANGHRIELDVPDDLPEVPLDPLMMEQVLGNLLENALRFTPHDAAITVRAAATPSTVEVRVVDRGPGVPSTRRAQVWEEFSQGEDGAGGAGLGLALVRSMVGLHGGSVWYEDTPGGGATFALALPRATA